MAKIELSSVATPVLERLSRHLEGRPSEEPLSAAECAALEVGGDLAVLPAPQLLAAVLAAIAERAASRPPRLELVWTGPEATTSRARDTRVVVSDLFAGAEASVLVAGFRFDHSDRILLPLHTAMRDRGVQAAFFIDTPAGLARAEVATWFAREHWTFGEPSPVLYVDARGGSGLAASLHAKCVVVDARWTLVTSANFTSRGQERNIELGVLVDDRAFAREVAQHWRSAAAAGYFTSAQ
jgi:phosphatidylserine/phosphatidylglycerophosphate/cardiolipin synthase-like enzyme